MSAILKQKLIDIAKGFTKYGLWNGGSSKLSELDDVTLTNLQSNDVLTYNGSVWVNDDNLQKQIDTLNSNLSIICETLNLSTGLKEYATFYKVYKSGNIKNLVVSFSCPSTATGNYSAGSSINIAMLSEIYRPICDFKKEIRVKDGIAKALLTIDSSSGIISLIFRETVSIKYLNIMINEVYI